MKIAFGCDHHGYRMKEVVLAYLRDHGFECVDCGTYSPESVDYPDYAYKAARLVSDGECERAIVICGSGIGVSITANKVRGVRCALCSEPYSARLTRMHNDSNVLAIGENMVGKPLALEIIDVWLHTDFTGGRHAVRIGKVAEIERAEQERSR